MSEPTRRFPYRLLLFATILLICAAFAGILALASRGTIAGRCERIKEGMTYEEVRTILRADETTYDGTDGVGGMPTALAPIVKRIVVRSWADGPARVNAFFYEYRNGDGRLVLSCPPALHVKEHPFTFWDVRRWAEQTCGSLSG
jgi:hypothetical protein